MDPGHVQAIREMYNVTIPVSSDYAAIFAIVAGLVIFLSLTVTYVAVGIWNMNPGRDSLIYRLTTPRTKKNH